MFAIFPELVRCAKAKEEEKLALLAHRYFGTGEPLRIRAAYEEMLVNAGIRLCYDTTLEGYGALIVKDERGTPTPALFIKKDLDWVEQKFLISYFLGRFLFDFQIKIAAGALKTGGIKELHSPYQRFLSNKRILHPEATTSSAKQEWLADEFAGAFLLPKQWLRSFVEKEREPHVIAAHFSVSIDFLKARIKHIRQKSENSVANSNPNQVVPPAHKSSLHLPSQRTTSPLSRIRALAKKIDPTL